MQLLYLSSSLAMIQCEDKSGPAHACFQKFRTMALYTVLGFSYKIIVYTACHLFVLQANVVFVYVFYLIYFLFVNHDHIRYHMYNYNESN